MKKRIALSLCLLVPIIFCACGKQQINVSEVLVSGNWYSTFDNSTLTFKEYNSGELNLGTGVELDIYETKLINWKVLEGDNFQITFFNGYELCENGPYVFQVEDISPNKKEPCYIIKELAQLGCIYLLPSSADAWETYHDYINIESTFEADNEGKTFGGAVVEFRIENEEFLQIEKDYYESIEALEDTREKISIIEKGFDLLG